MIQTFEWCHQQHLNLKYIVFSGYRHFEYVHGALQYGVDAYLLKPISQRELTDSLKKLVKALEEEQYSFQKLKNECQRDRDKLRRHFINSYIFDGRKRGGGRAAPFRHCTPVKLSGGEGECASGKSGGALSEAGKNPGYL